MLSRINWVYPQTHLNQMIEMHLGVEKGQDSKKPYLVEIASIGLPERGCETHAPILFGIPDNDD